MQTISEEDKTRVAAYRKALKDLSKQHGLVVETTYDYEGEPKLTINRLKEAQQLDDIEYAWTFDNE